MWNVLDKFAENVRMYSTPIGQLWNTITFVFRLFVIVAVGSSVYGDEQGAFKCDTGQPGCQNVCFNRFSPISHMRFWAFQILFVATPPMFFYLYAGMQTGKIKRLEAEKKKLKETEKEVDEARSKLVEANQGADDDDGRKSVAAFSTFDEKATTLTQSERKVRKLEKQVGRYKEKDATDISKGSVQTIIFTTKIRIVYILHCFMKLGIEILFLYLGYILQIQQSRAEGFWTKGAWTVPEKYTCNHAQVFGAAGSACAQQEKVTCWVSRPWEKQIFLYYMLTMTTLSIFLTVVEGLYMLFRVTSKGVQRRANKNVARDSNQTHYAFENGSIMNGGAAFGDTMMSRRSPHGIKNGLALANSYRYAQAQRASKDSSCPRYSGLSSAANGFVVNGVGGGGFPGQGYSYGGAPFIDDFMPDDGYPLFPRSRPGTMRTKSANGFVHPMHMNGTVKENDERQELIGGISTTPTSTGSPKPEVAENKEVAKQE